MIRDSKGQPVFAYRSGPPGSKASRKGEKHDDPEHKFQVSVAEALMWALPDEYLWTANAAGVRVTMHTAVKMKGAGVKRGWPDIQILFPTAVTRYIELKGGASLSDEQKAFRDRCTETGRDIWAMAKPAGISGLDEVEAILRRWGVPLRMPLAEANRYQAGAAIRRG